jgi:hypothetical protein
MELIRDSIISLDIKYWFRDIVKEKNAANKLLIIYEKSKKGVGCKEHRKYLLAQGRVNGYFNSLAILGLLETFEIWFNTGSNNKCNENSRDY